jgi:general secretion pathway protein G
MKEDFKIMVDKIRKVMSVEKGFTLVEMMVVLIIIAVLIALGIRAYVGYIGRAKMTKANGDITTIQAALDAYYAQNQSYPGAQSTLTSAGISSYEVNGGGPVAGIPPYGYTFLTTSGTYKVYTITSVNALYMEGIGTNGVSSPATLVPST